MFMKEQEEGESEQFYQQLEEQELVSLNRHLRGRRGGRTTKSGSETEAIYKQALMDSIFGRFQDASRKLKLMITLSPDSPQPYHLLGTMHEQLGQFDKAAEYLFMSTYLSTPNIEKWLKVGELSFERRMYTQSAYCFGRALKIANFDPKILLRRAEAFQLAGQPKKAITTYKRLLNTAASPEYAKKYARLRYRRGEYSLCRQILQMQPNFESDPHLVYMICETYLKEQNYVKAAELIEKHLERREGEMVEGEALSAEFLIILLICTVALNRNCYGYSAEQFLREAKECYESSYSQLYAQALIHIRRFSQSLSYQLVIFLLKYEPHKTVTNYVLATDYLCRQKDQYCIGLLIQALTHHPLAPELLAQQNYINKCFGISKKMIKENIPEDIFYSDQQSLQQIVVHVKHAEMGADDQGIILRLIQNSSSTLNIILKETGQNGPSASAHDQVLASLDFFISLTPIGREKATQKDGLYLRNVGRRRNDNQNSHKNIIYENLALVLGYFQQLLQYLLQLLKARQFRRMSQIGQRVSKVHTFKNQNKQCEFNALKLQIYELSVLSCLAIRKFNGALFFMRYLTSRHPQDKLYLLSLHLLLRLCGKKTFLSSALSKRLDGAGGQHLAKLLAIQYMDTGCFQLAISTFLRQGQNQEHFEGSTPQICLSACLLQIASSRNTYNKLDFANRSAICLANAFKQSNDNNENVFNRGRWFAQVKLNYKAIHCFQEVLKSGCQKDLQQRAAYCLICIFKQNEQFQKASMLSKQYFSLEDDQNEKND